MTSVSPVPGPAARSAATLRDVAVRAGVSPMSVSRAMRSAPGIGTATRQRILDAAAELGYRPNGNARNLRLGADPGLVGLVVTNLANNFYGQLATGVEEALDPSGWGLLIGNSHQDGRREARIVESLLERRVMGMILVPAGSDHFAYYPQITARTKVVFAVRPAQGFDADSVLVDDFGGARRVTELLIEQGHERIGFIGNPPTVYTGAERFRGYCVALEDAGIRLRTELVARSCSDTPSAEAAVTRLTHRRNPPTAVFATNNRLTLGALLGARRSEPELAIAGFDQLDFADLLSQPVVLATYDAVEIGRLAGRLLLDRVAEADQTPRSTGSARIIVPVRVETRPPSAPIVRSAQTPAHDEGPPSRSARGAEAR